MTDEQFGGLHWNNAFDADEISQNRYLTDRQIKMLLLAGIWNNFANEEMLIDTVGEIGYREIWKMYPKNWKFPNFKFGKLMKAMWDSGEAIALEMIRSDMWISNIGMDAYTPQIAEELFKLDPRSLPKCLSNESYVINCAGRGEVLLKYPLLYSRRPYLTCEECLLIIQTVPVYQLGQAMCNMIRCSGSWCYSGVRDIMIQSGDPEVLFALFETMTSLRSRSSLSWMAPTHPCGLMAAAVGIAS